MKAVVYEEVQYWLLKEGLIRDGYAIIRLNQIMNNKNHVSFDSAKIAIEASMLVHEFNLDVYGNASLYALIAVQLGSIESSTEDLLLLVASDGAGIEKIRYSLRELVDDVELYDVDVDSDSNSTRRQSEEVVPKRIVDLTEGDMQKLKKEFGNRLYGQEDFKHLLCDQIDSFRLFWSIQEQHTLSVLLLGPSGVGKTETARILHQLLDDRRPLAKIGFGNYSSKDSLNSLIGSPRGYKGSETGELVTKLGQSNTGILLLDEFEKADNAVHNFFLDLLENGEFTDSMGETHNLDGYICIFTTNATKDSLSDIFSAELLSRFDLIVNFHSLLTADRELLVRRQISGYTSKLREIMMIPDEFDDAVFNEMLQFETSNMRVLKNKTKQVYSSKLRELSV